MMHKLHKVNKDTTSNHFRHVKHREAQVPKYVGLMVNRTREKTVTQNLYFLGDHMVSGKDDNGLYKETLDKIDFLNRVSVSNIDTSSSWSKHHSAKFRYTI